MSAHDCTQQGHVWIEPDGTLYQRHRGRTPADVPVVCQFCLTDATLPAFARSTAPPQQLPPAIVIENGDLRATLTKQLALTNTGPVPKL